MNPGMGVALRSASFVILAVCLQVSGCSSRAERDSGYPVDRDVATKIHVGEISFGGGVGNSYEHAIAVLGANGSRIVVTWLDRRNDTANRLYQPFFALSSNPAHFPGAHPLSTKQSNPQNDGFGPFEIPHIARPGQYHFT